MLAAIGATEKHLRLVLLTGGALVGAIGALIGTVAGLALWLAVAPTLEPAVGHRIDRLSLPWPLLAIVVLVAVLGASAAAWWPGRAVARVPVTLALSARPPRPKPAHHSAILAALLIAAGIASLVLSDRSRVPLIIAGVVATILGTLLLGPLAIRLFARPARAHTDRGAPGAARPRPLPGALRGGARRHHARARHRRGRRRRRGRRGAKGRRRTAQPVRPADPRLHRRDGRSGRASRPSRPPNSSAWRLASASSRQISTARP